MNISHGVHLLPLEDDCACLEKLIYLDLFIIYTSSLHLPFYSLRRRTSIYSTSRIDHVIA